jgi:hypothetical protein
MLSPLQSLFRIVFSIVLLYLIFAIVYNYSNVSCLYSLIFLYLIWCYNLVDS